MRLPEASSVKHRSTKMLFHRRNFDEMLLATIELNEWLGNTGDQSTRRLNSTDVHDDTTVWKNARKGFVHKHIFIMQHVFPINVCVISFFCSVPTRKNKLRTRCILLHFNFLITFQLCQYYLVRPTRLETRWAREILPLYLLSRIFQSKQIPFLSMRYY